MARTILFSNLSSWTDLPVDNSGFYHQISLKPDVFLLSVQVEPICKHLGMVYAGMGPDYRVIVTETRKEASLYKQKYGEDIPTEQLVMNVAQIFQVGNFLFS